MDLLLVIYLVSIIHTTWHDAARTQSIEEVDLPRISPLELDAMNSLHIKRTEMCEVNVCVKSTWSCEVVKKWNRLLRSARARSYSELNAVTLNWSDIHYLYVRHPSSWILPQYCQTGCSKWRKDSIYFTERVRQLNSIFRDIMSFLTWGATGYVNVTAMPQRLFKTSSRTDSDAGTDGSEEFRPSLAQAVKLAWNDEKRMKGGTSPSACLRGWCIWRIVRSNLQPWMLNTRTMTRSIGDECLGCMQLKVPGLKIHTRPIVQSGSLKTYKTEGGLGGRGYVA